MSEHKVKKVTLEEALEQVSVHGPSQWENEDGPEGWYAVSTEYAGGIVAYFRDEGAAYRYRLDLVNIMLNPLSVEGGEQEDGGV